MRARLIRYFHWGDRQHWDITIGRTNISRWCPGAPCYLPGMRAEPHRIRIRRWARSWSRGDS